MARKCEECGREIRELAEKTIAYWCRDCKKLYPIEEVKPKRKRKKKAPSKKKEATYITIEETALA